MISSRWSCTFSLVRDSVLSGSIHLAARPMEFCQLVGPSPGAVLDYASKTLYTRVAHRAITNELQPSGSTPRTPVTLRRAQPYLPARLRRTAMKAREISRV